MDITLALQAIALLLIILIAVIAGIYTMDNDDDEHKDSKHWGKL